jgi:hypothetical protein
MREEKELPLNCGQGTENCGEVSLESIANAIRKILLISAPKEGCLP